MKWQAVWHQLVDYRGLEGDRFFPEFDLEEWNVESREDFAEFEYVEYSRKR